MKRLLLLLSGLMMSACLLAPVAQASISAVKAGPVLMLTSNNSGTVNETYTLRDEADRVFVKVSPASPGTLVDPDGGTECSASGVGDEVSCLLEVTSSVQIVAGEGADTIRDNRTQGPSLLEGGPGNDQITASSGAGAQLLGGAGVDTLIAVGSKALDSADSGGPGDDTLIGNPDLADRLAAEDGADTYKLGTHVASAGEGGDPATLQLESYPDRVSYDTVTKSVAVSLDGLANDGRNGEGDNVGADVEAVDGGSAADLLQAGPNAVSFSGFDGADQLLGGPGPDRLGGGAGNDVLRGGGGDDELDDGDFTIFVTEDPQPLAGNDVLDGGNGDDFLLSDRGADDLSGGPGIDLTRFSRPIPQAPTVPTPVAPAGFTVSLDDVANDGQTGTGEGDNVHSDIETIESSDGNDVISGSAAANEISTGSGADVVDPGAGPDVVDLGSGDDRIAALDQTIDVIRCRAGSDTAEADLTGAQGRPGDELSDCENVTGKPIPEISAPAQPGGGGPSVGDTARPIVTLSSRTIRSGTFLDSGHLDITVSCNEACSAIAKAYKAPAKNRRHGESPIGTGKLTLGTGKRTLRITVAEKSRAQLQSKLRTKAQRRRGVTFRVALTVKDAAGNVTNASRTVTVKG